MKQPSNIEELVASFGLSGKITEEHAREIEIDIENYIEAMEIKKEVIASKCCNAPIKTFLELKDYKGKWHYICQSCNHPVNLTY